VVLTGPDEAPDGIIPYGNLVEGQPDELAAIPVDPSDEADNLYTSGTTSRPKGVLVTDTNLIYLREVNSKLMRMGPEDRHLVIPCHCFTVTP
jgi:crotonobetaine/carnitine-CoA ligase